MEHPLRKTLILQKMPIKRILPVLLILGAFWWMNTATSKQIYFPCDYQLSNFLRNDTANWVYLFTYSHDTVILKANKDTLLDIKTSIACGILKDSCKINGYKILVVDTSYDQSTWNTPYGKRLFFRQCP